MNDKMFNDILDSIITNATPEEIETLREKLNTHLINHIYDTDIQEELSNHFDSSSCPHCHLHNIIKYGKDKKGRQRFFCNDCHKSFSSKTGSLLAYSKKAPSQWYVYMDSLFHGDTLKRSAAMAGICEYTAFVWRHKILSVCATLTDPQGPLSGTVYLDEKLVDVRHPGLETKEIKVVKRGISNQKRNIVCATDEHGKRVIVVSERGRIHSAELYKIYKDIIPSSCKVVSDSLRSYHKLMRDLGVEWIKIPSGKKEKDGYTLDRVNLIHSSIELFFHKYRGVSDKYIRNYIGLYKMKNKYKKYYQKDVFNSIFKKIVNSLCSLRYEDMLEEFKFSLIVS